MNAGSLSASEVNVKQNLSDQVWEIIPDKKKKSLRYRFRRWLYRPGLKYWKRHLLYFWGVHDEAGALSHRLREVALRSDTNQLRGLLITHLDQFDTFHKSEREAFCLDLPWVQQDLEELGEQDDAKTDLRRLLQQLDYILASSHNHKSMSDKLRTLLSLQKFDKKPFK